jgi:hypothetical protein
MLNIEYRLNLKHSFLATFFLLFAHDSFCQGTKLSIWNKGSESVSLVIYNSPVACKKNIAVEISFPFGLHNSNEWLVWTINYKDCNENLRFVECATPIGIGCARSDEFLSVIQSGASIRLEGEHTVIAPSSEYSDMEVVLDITNPHLVMSRSTPNLVQGLSCIAPINIGIAIENTNEALITWEKAAINSKYRVDYRRVGSAAWNNSKPLSTDSYRITGLEFMAHYEFKVILVCSSGAEAVSNVLEFRTSRPLCKVPILAIEKSSLDTIILSWTDTKSKFYIFQQRSLGGIWNEMKLNTNSVELTNLFFSTHYEFRVAGADDYGICEFSPVLGYNTISNPCGNPSNLMAGNISANSIQLSWSSGQEPTEYLVEYFYEDQKKKLKTKEDSVLLTGLPYNTVIKISVYNLCLGDEMSFNPAQLQVYTLPEKAEIVICPDFQYLDSLQFYLNNIPLNLEDCIVMNGCISTTLDLYQKINTIGVEYNNQYYTSQEEVFLPGENTHITLLVPQEIITLFECRKREVVGNFNPFIPFSISLGGSNLISNSDIENFQSSVTVAGQIGNFYIDATLRGLENSNSAFNEVSQSNFINHYLLDGSLGYHFSKFAYRVQRKTDITGVFIQPDRTAAFGLHIGGMNWFNTEVYAAKLIDRNLSDGIKVNGQSQINVYGGMHFKAMSHYSMKYRIKLDSKGRQVPNEQLVWREVEFAVDYLYAISHSINFYDPIISTFSKNKINSNQVSAGYRCAAKWRANLAGTRVLFSVQGAIINLPSIYSLREVTGFKYHNIFYNITFGFGWANLKQ